MAASRCETAVEESVSLLARDNFDGTVGGDVSPRDPKFFVFGAGRSGTTLLAFLLSGQPGLFCINDSFVFRAFVDSVLGLGPSEDKAWIRMSRMLRSVFLLPDIRGLQAAKGRSLREVLNRMQEDHFLESFPLGTTVHQAELERYLAILRHRYSRIKQYDDFLTEYLGPLETAAEELLISSPASIPEVFSLPLVAIARKFRAETDGKFLLGEKTPIHTVYGRWILALYPSARGILVSRHPLTNIASLNRRFPPLKRALSLYRRFSAALLELQRHERIKVARYEDLLARPQEVLSALVGWVGGQEFDSSLPMNAYVKRAYTGTSFDPGRDPDPDTLFDQATRQAIRTRFRRIFEAFGYQ